MIPQSHVFKNSYSTLDFAGIRWLVAATMELLVSAFRMCHFAFLIYLLGLISKEWSRGNWGVMFLHVPLCSFPLDSLKFMQHSFDINHKNVPNLEHLATKKKMKYMKLATWGRFQIDRLPDLGIWETVLSPCKLTWSLCKCPSFHKGLGIGIESLVCLLFKLPLLQTKHFFSKK